MKNSDFNLKARRRLFASLIAGALLLSPATALASTLTITELCGFPYDGFSSLTYPDGRYSVAPLVQASDGNFYGTTLTGGDDGEKCAHTCAGTVFKITPQGKLTRLYTFSYGSSSAPYANGSSPAAGLVQGRDGYLYGTTTSGGYPKYDSGVIFKISKTGQFQKLHDFCQAAGCPDGETPYAGLTLGRDGNLYGTTQWAGGGGYQGTIFRITPSGTFTKLTDFNAATGSASGQSFPGLIQASDGNFYGTTDRSVFRVTPTGQLTALHSFFVSGACTPKSNGCDAVGSLVQASNGKLYGVTFTGGANNAGTVFELSLTGDFQKIFDFAPTIDGYLPNSLIQASDGNLWGTTNREYSSSGNGWLYTITTSGSLLESTPLTSKTGVGPMAALIQGNDGKLYGTATAVGTGNTGSIFTVSDGLSSPEPTISTFSPAQGPVGATVTIQGTYFVGTDSVTFNGTSAEFKIETDGVITATVPQHATSGHIEVRNAGGFAVSATNFTVQ